MTMSTEPSTIPASVASASRRGREPGQLADVHRELRHPVGERLDVLVREQRRRDEDGDLLAVLHRLERRAHRDLGLAVADVAADDAVHRQRLLHVGLDLVDRRELVGRLDVGERVLELALPRGVRRERVTLGRHPRAVEPDQLGRDLLDRLAGAALRLGPVRAAEPVDRRRLAADVLRHLVERVGGHVQPVARLAPLGRRVLDDQVLALAAVDRAAHHLDVLADAVLLVHDVVAGLELDGVDRVAAPRRQPAGVLRQRPTLAGEVGLGEERELERRCDQPAVEAPGGDVDDAGLGGGRRDQARGHLGRTEALDRTLGRAVPVEHERDPPAVARPAAQILDRGVGVAPVAGRRLERAGERQ